MALLMTKAPAKPDEKKQSEVLCAVLDGGQIAVVRVVGRGNFLNSMPLKGFADHLHKENKPFEFVLDLHECETLDSTFMGTIASLSQMQTRSGRRKLVVLNANEHVKRLLKTLGLNALLDLREGSGSDAERLRAAEGSFKAAESGEVDRLGQIVHTLEAHKTLVKIDEENEVRFQSVIHYLEQSLKNAENGLEA